jgi:uncharacterized Tic20 family protein
MFCQSCGKELSDGAAFCGHCGVKVGTSTPAAVHSRPTSSDDDKLYAVLGNLGGIFFFFVPSLIVYLIKKDSDGWVVDSVKEALNWQITVAIISAVLAITVVGLLLLWPVALLNVAFCVIAAVKAGDRIAWRYPLAIRFLK